MSKAEIISFVYEKDTTLREEQPMFNTLFRKMKPIFSIYLEDEEGFHFYLNITDAAESALSKIGSKLTEENARAIYNNMRKSGYIVVDEDKDIIFDLEKYMPTKVS